MLEKIISKFKDVELIGISEGKNTIEIDLYDYYNKGIDFENDIESIIDEIKNKKLYNNIEWEVYNPPYKREDEGYESIFITIIK